MLFILTQDIPQRARQKSGTRRLGHCYLRIQRGNYSKANRFCALKIFAASCGPKGVLCLISDPDINIGLIRLILKRSGDELREILDEFLSEIPETLDSGLDLSDLDELTPD